LLALMPTAKNLGLKILRSTQAKNAGHLTGLFAISLQLRWLSSRQPHAEASDLLDLSSPA